MKLGTRGSTLAMTQARSVSSLLEPLVGPIEIVPIRTSGDVGNRDKLGAFVSEIEDAILKGAVDLGLHCLKDVPTREIDGLAFAAYLPREDARDALLTLGAAFADLEQGALIGTGSLRRTSQLAAHARQFRFKPLLGNVDTRLTKLQNGEYQAIILAIAGLHRLGFHTPSRDPKFGDVRFQALDLTTMVPAAGQATLVLQMRDDHPKRTLVEILNHPSTAICSIAERAFLSRFGGGCSVPVAAYAEPAEQHFVLHGLVASPDGLTSYRATKAFGSEQAEFFGRELAEELGNEGGFEIVEALVGRGNE